MIIAVDVQYSDAQGFIAAVAFNGWHDVEPSARYYSVLRGVPSYEPGQFYKRELPCILQLLKEHSLSPEVIVIDGYVRLDEHGTPGLGMHLYKALDCTCHIIGVAKRSFVGIGEQSKVLRGDSQNPLFVSSVGIELEQAKSNILHMHGNYRIPTLLKQVDSLCREQANKAR